ncbi:MAG: type II CAAX endopeptidase family protein [Micropepsaceae bacterium]
MGSTQSPLTSSLWQRLPAFVRAIIIGGLLVGAGIVPWVVLVTINLRTGAAVPWSVAAMALYLAAYWFYLRGWGPPKSTKEFRRKHLRAASLSHDAWNLSLLAGTAGLACMLVLLFGVYARVVSLPSDIFPDTSGVSPYAVAAYIFMLAAVAGVTEEAGYRGYMQSLIESHYGPTAAILATAIVFGLAHFNLTLMPVYLFVAVLLGVITYISNSILPGVLLHAAYDFLMVVLNWQFGNPVPSRIDLAAGPDAIFWAACVGASVFAAITLWALGQLRRAVRVTTHEL